MNLFDIENGYQRISYHDAVKFLLPRHYSGRTPNIKYAFGEYRDNELIAVYTFGKPASPSLCVGICGEEFSQSIYELNRLCRVDDYNSQLSRFVGYCLKELKKYNLIIVSYSDTAMNHHGYIYQACNFLYTGMTESRTDKYTADGKHSRHYKDSEQRGQRKVRSAKYRYVYICGDKRFRKSVLRNLKYPIMGKYPKGNNSNYILGTYLKDKTIPSLK